MPGMTGAVSRTHRPVTRCLRRAYPPTTHTGGLSWRFDMWSSALSWCSRRRPPRHSPRPNWPHRQHWRPAHSRPTHRCCRRMETRASRRGRSATTSPSAECSPRRRVGGLHPPRGATGGGRADAAGPRCRRVAAVVWDVNRLMSLPTWSADGELLAIATRNFGMVSPQLERLARPDRRKRGRRSGLAGRGGELDVVSWSPDGSTLAYVRYARDVFLYDVATVRRCNTDFCTWEESAEPPGPVPDCDAVTFGWGITRVVARRRPAARNGQSGRPRRCRDRGRLRRRRSERAVLLLRRVVADESEIAYTRAVCTPASVRRRWSARSPAARNVRSPTTR